LIDAERLARALHETKGERLERWEVGARKRRAFLATDPPVRAKPFDDLPESVKRNKIDEAAAAAERYEATAGL
jgi:hypothetical protein